MKMTTAVIDITKIESEIIKYDESILWVTNGLDENPTEAKRTYLTELKLEKLALTTFLKMYSKFASVQMVEIPIKKAKIIEVIIMSRVRDGGSLILKDKDENMYYSQFSWSSTTVPILTTEAFARNGGKLISDDIDLKIVEKFRI